MQFGTLPPLLLNVRWCPEYGKKKNRAAPIVPMGGFGAADQAAETEGSNKTNNNNNNNKNNVQQIVPPTTAENDTDSGIFYIFTVISRFSLPYYLQ